MQQKNESERTIRKADMRETAAPEADEPDPDVKKEIAYYNALPLEFNDFIDLPKLSDDEIFLVCAGLSLRHRRNCHHSGKYAFYTTYR